MSALTMAANERSLRTRRARAELRAAARTQTLDLPSLLETGTLPDELGGMRAFALMASGKPYPGRAVNAEDWLQWLNFAAARAGISLLSKVRDMPPEHQQWLATMWRRRHETGEDR